MLSVISKLYVSLFLLLIYQITDFYHISLIYFYKYYNNNMIIIFITYMSNGDPTIKLKAQLIYGKWRALEIKTSSSSIIKKKKHYLAYGK